MPKPRLLQKGEPAPRPTISIPKPEADFAGWGPRLIK
jgi:hypothetical protein